MGNETKKSEELSAMRAMKAVFWSFFGVRRGKDYQADVTHLTPTQLIIAGIVSAILFVAAIVVLVYFVTR
ncbi:DUF2970 domain-containing protein [Sulfurirhabdus autotrophica]|uniref:DUF2970 family protein n=1 Tax=Sulfurirhabdus autotrophica TaxID=1706046 RepID=A0A4V2W1M0_9PROT|nr:DUF2970 domain-containing protein [Sulfurirhabdus autotrophica]TCV84759.1 DUF2970 family protein [Sulfurirhabdus autotrophica]